MSFPTVSHSNSCPASSPSIFLSSSLVETKAQLDLYLACSTLLTLEQLNNAVQLIYRFVEKSHDLVFLNQFLRCIAPQLEEKLQFEILITLYIKASEFYPFVINDEIRLEHVWLLTRAHELSRKHHMPQLEKVIKQKIDNCEQNLAYHPHLIQFVIENNCVAVKVEKTIKTDLSLFKESRDSYLRQANEFAEKGEIELARKMYDSLPSIIQNTMKNLEVPNREINLLEIYRMVGEGKEKLPQEGRREYQWVTFYQEYQRIKECQDSAQFSQKMFHLFHMICEYCYLHLKKTSFCDFEVVLLGSFTRREGTRLSDFDCAFFLSDLNVRDNFIIHFLPHYMALVRFYLSILDDLWIVDSQKDGCPLQQVGCNIDEGDLEEILGNTKIDFSIHQKSTLIKRCSLVNTAEEMKKVMVSALGGDRSDLNVVIPLFYSLIFGESLFRTSHSFFAQFKKYKNSSEIISIFIHYHLQNNFQYRFHTEKYLLAKSVKNLKKSWIQPLTFFCFDLALYWGDEDVHTIPEILSRFKEKKRLPCYFVDALETYWLDLHLFKKEKQKDWKHSPDAGSPNEMILEKVDQSGYDSLQRFQLPVLSQAEYEWLERMDKKMGVLTESTLFALRNPSQFFTSLDPLILHCQKQFESVEKRDLREMCNQIVHTLNTYSLFSDIKPQGENCPQFFNGLRTWLKEEYEKITSSEKKIHWLYKLLKIEALFLWVPKPLVHEILLHIVSSSMENGWSFKQVMKGLQKLKNQIKHTEGDFKIQEVGNIGDLAGMYAYGVCRNIICHRFAKGEWVHCKTEKLVDFGELCVKTHCPSCQEQFDGLDKIGFSACSGQLTMNFGLRDVPVNIELNKIYQIALFSDPVFLQFELREIQR